MVKFKGFDIKLSNQSIVIKMSAMVVFFIIVLQLVSIAFHYHNAKSMMQSMGNNFRQDLNENTKNREITETQSLKENMIFLATTLGDTVAVSLFNLNFESTDKAASSFLKNKNILAIQIKERKNDYFAVWNDKGIKKGKILPDSFLRAEGLEKIQLKLNYESQDVGELTLFFTDLILKLNLEKFKKDSVASLENSIQKTKQDQISSMKFEVIILLVLLVLVLIIVFFFARSINKPLKEVIGVLFSYSSQISNTVVQQESISQQQASTTQETNTTMEELGSSCKLTAEQAESTAIGAQKILDLSREGQQKMKEMVQGMQTLKEKEDNIAQRILHLSEQTSKIGDITYLVSDFANETKMLAMNAAVEAVRAGEHGKGFSVLSVEIRKLADESKRSAERISDLVTEIQKDTNDTVMATEDGTKTVETGSQLAKATSETFQSVSSAIEEAAENAKQISLNVQHQATAAKQVIEAMGTLNQGATVASTGISQVKTGIETLKDAAHKLKKML